MFQEINDQGTTIIIATHAKEIVDSMRQRVIALESGKIVRDEHRGVYANAITRQAFTFSGGRSFPKKEQFVEFRSRIGTTAISLLFWGWACCW